MPGPSWSPVLASIGVFLLFLGVVFPGPLLVVGAIALGLSLLYWLSESLRIYDHDLGVQTRTELPVVVARRTAGWRSHARSRRSGRSSGPSGPGC